jgi:DNA helicase-2/ATP-dependent DNA helicase PcrA
LLCELNEAQREAVSFTEGPSLVIAGAGSGKTRVLTAKIAYLLQRGVAPHHILALTFTNKAAREMKTRIDALMGKPVAGSLAMGTFHSIFACILRYEASSTGFPASFTIYDAGDSKNLIKNLIKEMQLDEKLYVPSVVQARISNAKNALITPEGYGANREVQQYDLDAGLPLVGDLYRRYCLRCKQAAAMDFDDLLLHSYLLWRDHPAVLEKYRNIFRYILVDEYQDTNYAQHALILRLSEIHQRVTLVGDDAQSIYSFRGANIQHILSFKDTYPQCKVFLLEENYRSTRNILAAANSLIQKNKEQIPKHLFSGREAGHPVRVLASYSAMEEAFNIAHCLHSLRREGAPFQANAILYRTNAQSRLLEEALRLRNIPYHIYGGLSFFQRKEVKDMLAYFRLAVNTNDEEALRRIINYPIRFIGNGSVHIIFDASSPTLPPFQVICTADRVLPPKLKPNKLAKVLQFGQMMLDCARYAKERPADEAATFIAQQSGLLPLLRSDTSAEGVNRLQNTEELLRAIGEFVQTRREQQSDNLSLADYLADAALLTDQDAVTPPRNASAAAAAHEGYNPEEDAGVTLMTVHASKGLEFDNVFVAGLEEGLFPYYPLSMTESPTNFEEERRLLYVAITRARERCFLSYATSRFSFIQRREQSARPSRFFQDIDPLYLQS